LNHPLLPNTLRSGPDARGRFGNYGGRFVAETLMPPILELEEAYEQAKADPSFQKELDYLQNASPNISAAPKSISSAKS